MPRFFLYSLLALALGAAFALMIQEDPGYVLVSFRGWTFESTLGSMLIALFALIVFSFLLVWLLKLLNPFKLFQRKTWGHIFGSGNPEQASARGLQALLLGYWQEAYRLLVENAEKVQNPLGNYLAASLAAFERDDRLGWMFCLDRAEKKAGQDKHGVKSLRALLEQRSGNASGAVAILQSLKRVAGPSPFVLLQLKNLYVQLGDWDGLGEILSQLEQLKIVPEPEFRKLAEHVHCHRLGVAANESLLNLHHAHDEVPKYLRDSELVTSRFLQYLLRYEQDTEACTILTNFLKRQWSDELVGMVGYLKGGNPQHLLLLLEDWLKQRPNNPILLLTLGRLSLRNQLWGKGREYFDHALHISKSPEQIAEASAELARLLEHLGEKEKSLACYQRAMQLMERKLPDLPMPVSKGQGS